MKNSTRIFFTSALITLCYGCTYSNATKYDAVDRPKTTPASIEVVDAVNLTRPYRVIGTANSVNYNSTGALEGIRKQAAEMGGDAIISFGRDAGGYQSGTVAGTSYGGSGYEWTAKVIIWTDKKK